jgi:hypothetical protein
MADVKGLRIDSGQVFARQAVHLAQLLIGL